MDAVNESRRRKDSTPESSGPEIRSCRYCKGKFEVNPRFPHKEFCKEPHRKLFWKYGAQSIGKVAERIERDMRKLIASEIAGLRARIDINTRAVGSCGTVDIDITREIGDLRKRLERLENTEGLRGAVDAARRFARDVLNAGGGTGA